MSGYSASLTTTLATSANWCMAEIRAAAGSRIRLFEIGVTSRTAGTVSLAVGRTVTPGIRPDFATITRPVPDNPNDPNSTIWIAKDWDVAGGGAVPEQPSVYLKRGGIQNTIMAGVVWIWQDGLHIPPGKSIGVWNLTGLASSTYELYFALDE